MRPRAEESGSGAGMRRRRCRPVALFLGDLRLRVRAPGEAAPLSLMESGAEEALPVASLSRRRLS